MRLDIKEKNGERVVGVSPTEMFKSAYASLNRAQDEICKMSEVNIGDVTRKEILSVLKLANLASSALQGLDCWRKGYPHPDELDD